MKMSTEQWMQDMADDEHIRKEIISSLKDADKIINDLVYALSSAREMLGVFEDNGGHDGMGGKAYMACLNQIDEALEKAK